MRVYALTKLGKKVVSNGTGRDPDEARILNYLRENRTASEDEIEIAGGERYLLRSLKEHGLVKELTT